MTQIQKTFLFLGIILSSVFIGWYFYVDIHYLIVKRYMIFWSEDSGVQIEDFWATPNINSDSNIYFHHNIYLKVRNRNDITVYAVFDKSKSWIKDTSDFDYKIKSQKLIFDLYECFARKYNYKIDKIKNRKGLNFKDIEVIGDKNYEELEVYIDSIYESDLTRDEIIKIWRPKIDSLLVRYE